MYDYIASDEHATNREPELRAAPIARAIAHDEESQQEFTFGLIEVLQLMLAVSLASLVVVSLRLAGLPLKVSAAYPACHGVYSLCRAWQDLRVFLGFALGAMLCYLARDEVNTGVAASAAAAVSFAGLSEDDATMEQDVMEERAWRKEQFFAYMF